MFSFSTEIFIIGVNPYVYLPQEILNSLFKEFGKDRGPIPVKGKINGKDFIQTLVKYQGAWRLYINGIMLKATGLKVGNRAEFEIAIDSASREVPMHPKFRMALEKNKKAKETFAKYPPSRQKEINRYLNTIKTKTTLFKNIDRIIRHLEGEKVDYFVLLRNNEQKVE